MTLCVYLSRDTVDSRFELDYDFADCMHRCVFPLDPRLAFGACHPSPSSLSSPRLSVSLSLSTCSSTAYRKINKYKKHKVCRKLNSKGATKCFVWIQFSVVLRAASARRCRRTYSSVTVSITLQWIFVETGVAFTDWCLKTTTNWQL